MGDALKVGDRLVLKNWIESRYPSLKRDAEIECIAVHHGQPIFEVPNPGGGMTEYLPLVNGWIRGRYKSAMPETIVKGVSDAEI